MNTDHKDNKAASMKSIGELEHQIREFINRPRKQHALLQELNYWNMLCSSLDVIGDTEMAIGSYQAQGMPEDTGLRYLLIYGILQAMVLQQDAVKHLAESLGLKFADAPCWDSLKSNMIRDVRNDSIGHPTKRDRNKKIKGSSFHFISRISIEKEGFYLLNTYSDPNQKDKFTHVDLRALFLCQHAMIAHCMQQILEKLEEEDMEHRKKYKDRPLAQVVRSCDDYVRSIYESLHGNRPPELASMHLNFIKECISKYTSAMEERGIYEAYESIKYQVELIAYPLESMSNYFNQSSTNKLSKEDANIFMYFIEHNLAELTKMTEDVDDSYKMEPE